MEILVAKLISPWKVSRFFDNEAMLTLTQHSPMQTMSATARIGGKALEDESMLRPGSQRDWNEDKQPR